MGARLDASSLLSLGCAAVMLAALAAPFALLRRAATSEQPAGGTVAVAAFWSTSNVAQGLGFVLGVQASGLLSYYYFVPILYAVAATVPLVLAGSTVTRSLAAGGVALVALTSLVNLLGRAEQFNGKPAIAAEASTIIEIATRDHALVGYGPYWDASDLAWASRGTLQVAPGSVRRWSGGAVLYRQRGLELVHATPRTFVPARRHHIESRDGRDQADRARAPEGATERLGPDITMWIYPYDIATRFAYPAAPWSPDPTISTGSGFNAMEQYLGAPAHWMIQDGRLVVSSDVDDGDFSLSATLFSNGQPRDASRARERRQAAQRSQGSDQRDAGHARPVPSGRPAVPP